MAKKDKPSETAVAEVPAQDTPLPEPVPETGAEQEVAKPEEETPVAEVQEAEKPDLRAQLEAASEDERDAIYEEVYGERLKRSEQSARDSAYTRFQAGQHQQMQANKALQDTLRNLEGVDEDGQRAGHIEAYATWRMQSASQQWAQEALENVRESLGVSREEHDEITLKLHQQGAREKRVPTFGDYVTHVTGERLMPKSDVTKQIQAEVKAALAEQQGRRIESQEAPVSTGQGEPSNQEAADNRTLTNPAATGEQKAGAFERLYGYRPRNI